MSRHKKSQIPLYISAVLVFIGIISNIFRAAKSMSFYSNYSAFSKIKAFFVEWLSGWIWSGFDNPIFFLPLIAFLFQLVWFVNYIIKKKHKDKQQRKKAAKILFILSFSPMILIILYSVKCFFTGFQGAFVSNYTYGTQAFFDSLFWMCVCFSYIPILPLMLIYQIVYIVSAIRQGRLSKEES